MRISGSGKEIRAINKHLTRAEYRDKQRADLSTRKEIAARKADLKQQEIA